MTEREKRMMRALLAALEWADLQRARPEWADSVCSLVEELQETANV